MSATEAKLNSSLLTTIVTPELENSYDSSALTSKNKFRSVVIRENKEEESEFTIESRKWLTSRYACLIQNVFVALIMQASACSITFASSPNPASQCTSCSLRNQVSWRLA